MKGFIIGVIVALPLGALAQAIDVSKDWAPALAVDTDGFVRAGGRDEAGVWHPLRMTKDGNVVCAAQP